MYSVLLATMLATGGDLPNWPFHHHHGCCCFDCGCAGQKLHGRLFHHHRHHHHGHPVSCSCCCGCFQGCCCGGGGGFGFDGMVLPSTPILNEVPSIPVVTGSNVANSSPVSSGVAPAVAVQNTPANLMQPVSRPAPAAPAQAQPALDRLPTASADGARKVAWVVVTLPEDARLFVDNVECPIKSAAVRSFNTRPLDANQLYFYTIRMDVIRDGRVVSESRHVTITPGEEIRVNFNQGVAAQTAGAR